jgi:hypothetical protein
MKTLGLLEPMWMDGWMDEMMKAVVGVRFWKPNMYIIIIVFLDG